MRRAAIIFLLVTGCANKQYNSVNYAASTTAKSLCDIMINPEQFIGQRIFVKGIYFREPHRRIIYDDNCPKFNLSVSHASHLSGNKLALNVLRRALKIRSTGMISVVYSAVLTVNSLEASCDTSTCYKYSLTEAQLLAASSKK